MCQFTVGMMAWLLRIPIGRYDIPALDGSCIEVAIDRVPFCTYFDEMEMHLVASVTEHGARVAQTCPVPRAPCSVLCVFPRLYILTAP